MTRLFIYMASGMTAILLIGTVFGDRLATYDNEISVLVFGALLGVLSFFVKPIIQAVSLPVTCLTFGLFALVIETAFFALAGQVAPGIEITLLGAAVGGVVASVLSGIIFSVLDDDSVEESHVL